MTRYGKLRRDILLVTLLVAVMPLIILGGLIYFQFATVLDEKIESQLSTLARAQSSSVEVFLRERTAILSTIVGTTAFSDLSRQEKLTSIFRAINRRTDGLGLVDLGLIDGEGNHLAYVGPYDLQRVNYAGQSWFEEALSKGRYVSDVFMGFRRIPHFIISVRGYDGEKGYILRATIDSDVFSRLVHTVQTGQGGDAFIINAEGIYQTSPRFHGEVLSKATLDVRRFDRNAVSAVRLRNNSGTHYAAGAWMNDSRWVMVVLQTRGDEYASLIRMRNIEIMIIAVGCLGIIFISVIATHLNVRRLEAADKEVSTLNAQLMQNDKLAALGKMAAGIAHEINNPLAVIGEKAGWMRDLLDEEAFRESDSLQEYRTSLNKIEEHVERARKITHSMLGFARRMEPRSDNVDIRDVLRQTIDLMQSQARSNNITITTRFNDDLPVIASDQSQLQQVFLNLLTNALDAIGADGSIHVTAERMGAFIDVQVSDNGVGILEHQQRRIFDPFFTTKETGKGTGLGLSVSHSIVEKMGGSLSFTSAPGEGTTFTVRLPIIEPEKQ
ncbi:MAG: ATP-binding protein [Desulfosarcinaceae bacterium]